MQYRLYPEQRPLPLQPKLASRQKARRMRYSVHGDDFSSDTNHITLMFMDSFYRMYPSILLVSARLKVRFIKKRNGLVTYVSCCLMTILERIFREELTTAAHVSSADDSMARTLKWRLVKFVKERRQSLSEADGRISMTPFEI